MALRIQKNVDGSFKDNRSANTADMFCDVCRHAQAAVNINNSAIYVNDIHGNTTAISLACTTIGGSCDSITFWPLLNGTADAVELALVKTA
jgi:hypothetical protein